MDSCRKVALITGASSGFGAGTAVHLAMKGYRLTLNGRNPERLAETARRCHEAGLSANEVLLVPGDVRDPAVASSAVQQTVDTFGRLDLLVNNAGTTVIKDALDSTMDDYNLVMDTNVKATVMWSLEAAPHLIGTKGNIVNVSSHCSNRSYDGRSFYVMSKAAVDMFTRCLANELGPNGVRVNSVNPGVVHTRIFETGGMDTESITKMKETFVNKVQPIHVEGTAGDIAMAIAYLASDQARFITGTTLTIDGGAANKMQTT